MRILHGMQDIAGQASFEVLGLQKQHLGADLVVRRANPFSYSEHRSLNLSFSGASLLPSLIKSGLFFFEALLKYQVFHFHFATSLLPLSLDLPVLRLFRKKVFMEYHGSEIRGHFLKEMPKNWPLPPPASTKRNQKTLRRIDRYIDGYILHDQELVKHLPSVNRPIYFLPLKINLDRFAPSYPGETDELTIVHAPSHRKIKGSDQILAVLETLKKDYSFRYLEVHGKTQAEALEIFQQADIIIDQLFLGTYGVFSIEAMALGKPVLCHLSEEMEQAFPPELPVINVNPKNLKEALIPLLTQPALRTSLGKQGRRYVEAYHDYRVVARALQEIYRGTYQPKTQQEAFAYVKQLSMEAKAS